MSLSNEHIKICQLRKMYLFCFPILESSLAFFNFKTNRWLRFLSLNRSWFRPKTETKTYAIIYLLTNKLDNKSKQTFSETIDSITSSIYPIHSILTEWDSLMWNSQQKSEKNKSTIQNNFTFRTFAVNFFKMSIFLFKNLNCLSPIPNTSFEITNFIV